MSAVRAPSERSGHSSPSARRRNRTRSRHCDSAFDQGHACGPSDASPRARARAASSVAGTGSGRSLEDEGPERRTLRARRAFAPRSNATSSVSAMWAPRPSSSSSAAQGRGGQDAGGGRRPRDLRDRQERLPGETVVGFEACGASVGHQVLARPAARLGDAVRIGEGEQRAEGGAFARPGCGPGRAGPALRHAAHVVAALRPVAPEALDAIRQVDGIAAEAALDQDCGEIRRIAGPADLAGRDDHAGQARRAAAKRATGGPSG